MGGLAERALNQRSDPDGYAAARARTVGRQASRGGAAAGCSHEGRKQMTSDQ